MRVALDLKDTISNFFLAVMVVMVCSANWSIIFARRERGKAEGGVDVALYLHTGGNSSSNPRGRGMLPL